MHNPLDESNTKYRVTVGGRVISEGLTSRHAAELVISGLTEEERLKAQIVPVSSNGNQILFG